MSTKKTLILLFAICLMLFGMGQVAQAGPTAVGPTNATNGFPEWYMDENEVVLAQCDFPPANPPDPNCIPSGPAGIPIPGIDFEEAFWWAGETSIASGGVDALLVLALEAAFATGEPEAGQQIVFGRIRIRADVPVIGTYTFTHPYGTRTFVVNALDAGNEINETIDIGGGPGDFASVFAANTAGPFLSCVTPAPPAGYLGNFGTPCTITGSPTGNNFFRVVGPGIDITQTQFNISGKLLVGAPIAVDSAVYSRSAANAGQIDVFASSISTATMTLNGAPMTKVGNKFFGSLPFSGALPAVTLIATSATGSNTAQPVPVDMVSVTQAEFSGVAGTLTVTAFTSDLGTPAPTLSAFTPGGAFIGNLTTGAATVLLLATPIASVEVRSSAGGSATASVTLPPAVAPPVITSTCGTTATVDLPYSCDVNATDPNGDALTYSLVTAPLGMTINGADGLINWTPAADQVGPNTVTVHVQDPGGLFAEQTFTITVSVTPPNTAPTITSTCGTAGAVGQPYNCDVNATDPEGNPITFSLTVAPAGMTITAATGLISWTPTAGQTGPNNVTVRATDSGALFGEQSFTVTVTQPDTITVTKAEFKQIGSEWRIEGTSLPVPVGPRTISVFLGPTVAGGTLIGTTNVAADGKWTFLQLNSPVRPPSTLNQKISVQSSSGGKLENVTLLIRR